LLEGYFSLKRQVTVELLADCATHASEADLKLLGDACFAVWDAAHWEPGERCAQLEFELLKLAARVTDRPGHLLLIQSLQRAMRGMAARVLPLVGGEALRQWALCAMNALWERDAEALQRKLLPLLRACDECILGQLAPVPQEEEARTFLHTGECVLGRSAPAAQEDEALEANPNVEERGLARLAPAAEDHEAFEAHPSIEERVHGRSAPAVQDAEALDATSRIEERGLGRCAPAAGEDLPGAVFENLSDCRTGSCASPPEERLQPQPPSADSGEPTRVATMEAGGLLHGTRSHHPPPAVPDGLTPRQPPLPIPQDCLPCERREPCVSSSRVKASTPSPEG
jgi:hypothetical protein